MKKTLLTLTVVGMIGFGCSSGPEKDPKVDPNQSCVKLDGGRYKGNVFRLSETEYISTLFPQALTDAVSYRTCAQIYEGLLKFNQKDLSLDYALAESYDVDESGTVYTFKIRKGVFFHDNACFANGKGREVKADDIVNMFELLSSQNKLNKGFSTVVQDNLLGANEYFAASAGGSKPSFPLKGVKKIDDYTVSVTLERPNSVFKYHLAGPYTYVFPKEMLTKYKEDAEMNPVGTGPFMLTDIEKNVQIHKRINLSRNPNYWKKDSFGNTLPYLDGLDIYFANTKTAEMDKFKKKELDMIYQLPNDVIINILTNADKDGDGVYENYKLQRQPEMATHFVAFLSTFNVFQDINLRKAFSFAVNRKEILEYVLDGEADSPGWNGITPNTFEKYQSDKITGYSFNEDSAKIYFEKTKYGKNPGSFPKLDLTLNTDGNRNLKVAQAVQKQLKVVLGIEVEIKPLPQSQFTQKVVSGKTNFFRLGWLADYPHPQAFLQAYYGKSVPEDPKAISYPNLLKYKSSGFDKYYEAGMTSKTEEEAFENFKKAEQILMNDCPFVVLWYNEAWRLLQPNVRNFPNNSMQFRDFSEVYFDCPEVLNEK